MKKTISKIEISKVLVVFLYAIDRYVSKNRNEIVFS